MPAPSLPLPPPVPLHAPPRPGRTPAPPGAPRRRPVLSRLAVFVQWLLTSLVVAGGLVVAAPPTASLSDPTRPPAAYQVAMAASAATARTAGASAPGLSGAGGHASALGAQGGGSDERPAQPLLQGVQVSSRGAPTAMIDGRLVKVGDMVGQRQVATIDTHGVVLRGGGAPALRLSLLTSEGKQPPGSIVISRRVQYAPGAQPTSHKPQSPADPDAAPAAETLLPPTPLPTDSAVAVAGKTRP